MTYPISVNVRRDESAEIIRSYVSGIPSRLRGKRHFLMLQAFLDESFEKDPPVFVLAGYLASAEQWLRLTEEWDKAITTWTLPVFKMKEAMYEWSEGMQKERLGHLHAVIAEHVRCALWVEVDSLALNGLMTGPFVKFSNPYFFCVFALVMMVVRSDFLKDEKVRFIFDKGQDEKAIRGAWEEFVDGAPTDEIKSRFGGDPIFEKDDDLIPLQTADFLAYWRRQRGIEAWQGSAIALKNTPWIKPPKKYGVLRLRADVDYIIRLRSFVERYGLINATDIIGEPKT
jgi:hypothetical protein